ncbi:DUF1361 domain-containing protein [Desnuesiella massiliensis]|uniref:DUF1361 domain-containing protein n=1 Tax=Desnuesiella massiliensis TaxID=1650662 RepID=UPI0006E31964|nr:DUF1361 domain-containing protein [Desnuesiella massiliensis]
MSKRFNNIVNLLRIFTLVFFIWIVFGTNRSHSYLVWNVFLAWIPLELVNMVYKLKKKYRNIKGISIICALLALVWLLFYPNAAYIITDFIHIATNKYRILNPHYEPYVSSMYIFNDDLSIWVDLFSITIGAWLGFLLGFLSLFMAQRLIEKRFGAIKAWIGVVIVNMLSGFAIYLGRFIRWNSWDLIFNPYNIIKVIEKDVHFKSFYFTLLFGSLCLALYIINYLVAKACELVERE